MKKILVLGSVVVLLVALGWTVENWAGVKADYMLARTDWAISRTKSWRMRLETTNPHAAKEWMVIEAIPPDREHGWQHVDRTLEDGSRITGNIEYIRIRDDRYFRGDAMFGHQSSSQWIKLIPRDFPPLDGFFELRLHMSNPRTIGYSFDSIETTFWSNYHDVRMQPEGVKVYFGHPCIESSYHWTIEETGRVMRDTVCVGASDHLPYHLTTSGGWAEATYEWNPEISISAPSPVFPRPRGFVRGQPDF